MNPVLRTHPVHTFEEGAEATDSTKRPPATSTPDKSGAKQAAKTLADRTWHPISDGKGEPPGWRATITAWSTVGAGMAGARYGLSTGLQNADKARLQLDLVKGLQGLRQDQPNHVTQLSQWAETKCSAGTLSPQKRDAAKHLAQLAQERVHLSEREVAKATAQLIAAEEKVGVRALGMALASGGVVGVIAYLIGEAVSATPAE